MSQPGIVATINRNFVAVEYDAAQGFPPQVAGWEYLRRWWEANPWTRVSFGQEMVLEPGGKFALSVGYHGHDQRSARRQGFDKLMELSLARLARIRAHERNSSAEKEEIERVVREVEREQQAEWQCMADTDLFTLHTLVFLWCGNDETASDKFDRRIAGAFAYPDPAIRKQIVAAVGRFVAQWGSSPNPENFEFDRCPGFPSEEVLSTLRFSIVDALDDPEPEVRAAAEQALQGFPLLFESSSHPADARVPLMSLPLSAPSPESRP